MALFGIGKNKTEKKVAKKATKATRVASAGAAVKGTGVDTTIILRPHITEKAGIASGAGVYTFDVAARANKHSVAQAVRKLYGVEVVKVAISNQSDKPTTVKGRPDFIIRGKKAMVTLPKGATINFI